ncbi:MAG TPA: NAD(P)-dependent oxidoreductase [Longimicrobium sp.]|nr:NAD(P)-dependent oxidoreductase [Longimicrobium sp.]
MKIVIFGATGHIGQRIAREALERGHEVVGVVRDPARSQAPDPRVRLVQGDATDAESVARAVQGADAVVSAVSPRPGTTGEAPSLSDAARGLIAGLRQAGVQRLIVVGGAGSLEVAPGVALMDAPGFPDAYRAEAEQGRDSLAVYRTEADGLEWTFQSPAIVIQAGERTGHYRTTGDALLTDEQGNSVISFEDYAVALVDELEQRRHVGQRFGVAY